jgi:hypothetical protein
MKTIHVVKHSIQYGDRGAAVANAATIFARNKRVGLR